MMSLVLDLGKEEFPCTIYYYWVKSIHTNPLYRQKAVTLVSKSKKVKKEESSGNST